MVEIRMLDKRDYKKAMEFAIKGMHFTWYTNSRILLSLYTRYFLYLELNKATQILAAYEGDTLLGLLLAEMYREKPVHTSKFQQIYVKVADWLQDTFVAAADDYADVNDKMHEDLVKAYEPDGELCFFAVAPEAGGKGVGTALLNELIKREKGKRIYLYTDSACTYQFYESRGFERFAQQHVEFQLDKKVSLDCFLYRRTL